GPLIGGLVMTFASWRAVFLVYLPFLMVSGILLMRLKPVNSHARVRIDSRGVSLFSMALALLIALIQGDNLTAGMRIGIAGIILMLLAILFLVERRHPWPAVDPVLFLNPVFGAMSLVVTCWQISIAVSMVYVPAMVVAGMGGSTALAGASILPMAVALFASVPLGPKLVRTAGVRRFVGVCIGLMVAGELLIWLALHTDTLVGTAGLVLGLMLMGIGGGTANGSMDNLAMSTISPQRAGMAAGVFQTVKI